MHWTDAEVREAIERPAKPLIDALEAVAAKQRHIDNLQHQLKAALRMCHMLREDLDPARGKQDSVPITGRAISRYRCRGLD